VKFENVVKNKIVIIIESAEPLVGGGKMSTSWKSLWIMDCYARKKMPG